MAVHARCGRTVAAIVARMLTRTELVELKDHVFEVAAESAERNGELLLLFLQSD